jgi:hypothetical protein
MLKAVSDQHEFGSKKRVNDCAKENQGPHEIKRLGLNPVNELRRGFMASNLISVSAASNYLLETPRGQRFWSVYIAKPGSKNAKEVRVDATSGQILAVQTERPEDQAEEPPKTH